MNKKFLDPGVGMLLKMKFVVPSVAGLIALLSMVASCSGAEVKKIEPPEAEKTVVEVTDETFKTVVPKLMGTVFSEVKKGGYAGAVEFCNENVAGMGKKATKALGEKFEKEHGVQSFRFGRTSHRLRNPANAPNAIQEAVLSRWLAKEKAGQEIGKVYTEYDGKYYGFVPIRINNETCLGCHGTPGKINEAAVKVIDERYPGDQAKGFEMNELRGAFWVSFDKKGE